jgi:hypothetical protein
MDHRESSVTAANRERMLSASFALWGLAIAIALAPVWLRHAPPGQLPGLATKLDFDAHAPFRFVAGLMLLPTLLPLLLRPLTRVLLRANAWAANAVAASVLVTLWIATISQGIWWTLIPCAIAIALCAILGRRDLAFTRADFILLPVFLTTLLSIIDVAPNLSVDRAVLVAALLVFAVRIAVAFVPSPLTPAYAFALAPVGLLLQTSFFARDQRYFGWHALALVVVTPFVLRVLQKDRRWWRRAIVLVVYPLALYCYANAMSQPTAEGKSRVNSFEDSHEMLPASEYARGERPYRDILPAHGLLQDGGLDYLIMKLADPTVGTRLRTRLLLGNLNSVALYFLALAITGSAEGALLSVVLCFMTGAYTMNVRLLPPLVTLALLALAVRQRRPRLFLAAAFATVVCGVMSIDFGFYTFVTLAIALLRFRDKHAWRFAAIGVACGVVPLIAGLAIYGILGDFVRATFVEVPAVSSAYTLTLFTPPAAINAARAFPDVLIALLDRESFHYFFWCAIAVFIGVTLARRPSRRYEPLVVLGIWTVLVAISYAERHHLYFSLIASLFAVFVVMRLLRRRSPLAIPAIAALIVLAGPTTHLGVLGWMRHARGPVEPNFVELRDPPRARGAWWHASDAQVVEATAKYIRLSLAPDETFFDFTNRGFLYHLFRRDCPIREYEVAFYETEAAQREVIRRIEENPRVRAALLPGHIVGRHTVDGLTSAERAPLVWEYLQSHFHPDFEEGDVVFWRRN